MQMSKYLQRIHSSIEINIYTVINEETEIKKLGWIGIAQAQSEIFSWLIRVIHYHD